MIQFPIQTAAYEFDRIQANYKKKFSTETLEPLREKIVPLSKRLETRVSYPNGLDLWLRLPISNSMKHFAIYPPLNEKTPIAVFGLYDQFIGLPRDCAMHLARLGRSEKYNFLSNFYPIDLTVDGRVYRSVEHFYQASKFPIDSPIYNQIVSSPTAAEAHRIGTHHYKKASLGDDPLMAKRMKRALYAKFVEPNGEPTEVGRLLLETGDRMLIEGNRRVHSNTRWGAELHVKKMGTAKQGLTREYSIHLHGQNLLGELLMEIRKHLQTSELAALPAPF